MKTPRCTGFLVGALGLATATSAFADDKAACLGAASQGQSLRDARQLVEARYQFRACARKECPAVVQTDCAAWLDATEKSLPTVVLAAKDRSGGDLVKVKVQVDGKPVLTALDGKAVPLNPGPHVIRFDAADGSSLDQQVVVKEGERNRVVAVVLGQTFAPVAPPAPAHAQGSSGGRTAGIVIAVLGVVGVGVGAVAGVVAIGDKSSAHCVGTVCSSGPLASAKSAAAVSDVGLIAGGVLLAGGVTLVLVGGKGKSEGAPRATLAPMIAANGGGLSLGGSF